jgi:HlyD family secretion protein
VISQQEFDVAQAAARRAVASRNSASAAWEQARNGARPEEIAAARAEVASAAAAARAVSATASDLVLLAPFPGVITSRNAEPGEVLAPGRSAVTVGRTARPWVRVYLGQAAVAQIKVGQRAEGRLDDFPSRTFPGAVAAISTRAEFTPRVALTEQERADMLFGVKVEFTDTTGMLKAGMPITVRVVP